MNDWEAGLDAWIEQFEADAYAKARSAGNVMEARARASAAWTDETGRARRSITVTAERTATEIKATLVLGVPYAKYLERSFGGRYAVIEPNFRINRNFPIVMARRGT